MGIRTKWEFTYTAGVLAKAAAKQRDHRLERKKIWQDKYAEVFEEIKNSGVKITESVAKSIANTANYSSNSYGMAPTVSIDPSMQQRLQECSNRVRAHDEAAREYDGWFNVLEANEDDRLNLNHEDWLYFFGGLEIDDEEDED